MGKKGASKQGEESPFEKWMIIYKKRYNQASIPIPKQWDQKLKNFQEEDIEFEQLHLWEKITPNQIKILFDIIKEAQINTLKSIRFWKVKCKDEGCRIISKYLETNETVTLLDLMDNEIMELGSEFISNALKLNKSLTKLYLDHNNFGDIGLKYISEGLRLNENLLELSISYVGIGKEGSHYIQQILVFVNTKLEKLNLQGNKFENEGIFQILRSFNVNNTLKELNIADNQFFETKDIIDQTCKIIDENDSLTLMDMKYNGIYENGMKAILEHTKKKNKCKFEISDNFNSKISTEFVTVMSKINKGKKKKKKPKKK